MVGHVFCVKFKEREENGGNGGFEPPSRDGTQTSEAAVGSSGEQEAFRRRAGGRRQTGLGGAGCGFEDGDTPALGRQP